MVFEEGIVELLHRPSHISYDGHEGVEVFRTRCRLQGVSTPG